MAETEWDIWIPLDADKRKIVQETVARMPGASVDEISQECMEAGIFSQADWHAIGKLNLMKLIRELGNNLGRTPTKEEILQAMNSLSS